MNRQILSAFTSILTVVIALFALLIISSIALVPDVSSAQGFVPCTGVDCRFCHFIQMGNTILNWLFGLVFVLFGVVTFVAGFGLMTSGGNQSKLDDAKKKLSNAVVGIIIIFAAWLIVDTVMKTLVNDGSLAEVTRGANGEGRLGMWNEIDCGIGVQTTPGPGAPIDYTVNDEGQFCPPDHDFYCFNPEDLVSSDDGELCFADDTMSQAATGCNADESCGVITCYEGNLPGTTDEEEDPTECPIQPLAPITDPAALAFENGDRIQWSNPVLQQCVNEFISQVGGSVTSAYRPQAYQNHLREVSTKACQLSSNTNEACAEVRAEVMAEMSNHGLPLCGAVAATSRHSSGNAVDISGIVHSSQAVQSAAAESCLRWSNYTNDPNHYDLIAGCTCD